MRDAHRKIIVRNVICFTQSVTKDAMSSRHSLRPLVRAITAVFVFAVGMLSGAGVAALLMPT